MHRDSPFYETIFEPNKELDTGTLTIFQVMCTALAKYFRVAVKEFLPGGEFENLDANDVKGVPTHSKFPEWMFGYWRMLMNYMPNVGTLMAEAFTLFVRNNTYEWIKAKGDEERHAIIRQCQCSNASEEVQRTSSNKKRAGYTAPKEACS